jgi:hypothetical protein
MLVPTTPRCKRCVESCHETLTADEHHGSGRSYPATTALLCAILGFELELESGRLGNRGVVY